MARRNTLLTRNRFILRIKSDFHAQVVFIVHIEGCLEGDMSFRADEAARAGLEELMDYFVLRLRDGDEVHRPQSRDALLTIVEELGPVVKGYPTWHPLVANHDSRYPVTTPSKDCGYEGLDHTRYFAHGFITCPYGDGEDVLNSVAALPAHPAAYVTAERLEVTLYNRQTTPILVKCTWDRPLAADHMIPLSIAMPLILESEVPCWRWATRAETWETMRPYFLGHPYGSRSSLFVSQETGQSIKTIWNALIHTGMFGPIKV